MSNNNIYITNQNIQLLIFAWGKTYESKLNLMIDSLINDVIILKKNYNISLIFLVDNSLKNLLEKKLFLKLSYNKIKFKTFDISNKLNKNNFFNKIQEYGFSISRSLKSDIIVPIYSDFIFFKKSLINVVNLLANGEKKIVFQPILCLVEEKVYKKIKKRLEDKKVLNQNDFTSAIILKNNIHNIQKMMIINNNSLCLSPAWNIYISKYNDVYISAFHNSPIAFRTDLLPKKIELKISSDQDFTNTLFNNLKYYSDCYFIKNSNESLIISLKSVKDEPLKINSFIGSQNNKKTISSAKTWVERHTNNFHKHSSNFIYFINNKSNKKKQKIINFINGLTDRLLS